MRWLSAASLWTLAALEYKLEYEIGGPAVNLTLEVHAQLRHLNEPRFVVTKEDKSDSPQDGSRCMHDGRGSKPYTSDGFSRVVLVFLVGTLTPDRLLQQNAVAVR